MPEFIKRLSSCYGENRAYNILKRSKYNMSITKGKPFKELLKVTKN